MFYADKQSESGDEMSKKVYKMWGLFNMNRPPIFVQRTRYECRRKGIVWTGSETRLNEGLKAGWFSIEKITVTRP